MKITSTNSSPADVSTDLLAVACFEETFSGTIAAWPEPLAALDKALSGNLARAVEDEKFKGKVGQRLSLATLGNTPAKRIVIAGCGPSAKASATEWQKFGAAAIQAANAVSAQSATLASCSSDQSPLAANDRLHATVIGALLGGYKFDRYIAEDKRKPSSLKDLTLCTDAIDPQAQIARGEIVAEAICAARDWVNEPAAHLTPNRMAQIARNLATNHGLQIEVLNREECRKQGMGLFLGVAQGGVEEPQFIHLTWKPKNAKGNIALVGKGVTFDSGGHSLKPSAAMFDMKTDMAGCATVIAAIAAIARLNLPIEVHAFAACTENMISGSAYRLGDILRARNGTTVEINNTDAEGRLTLADAISYAKDFKPDCIVDLATLTGACMVALGPGIAGVMDNNNELADEWMNAAKTTAEAMWRLPLPEDLMEMLKSPIADMRNTGERWGGALTAGLFLKHFAGDTPWLHIDIAGPSTSDKDNGPITKGGTGFAVATVVEFVAMRAR